MAHRLGAKKAESAPTWLRGWTREEWRVHHVRCRGALRGILGRKIKGKLRSWVPGLRSYAYTAFKVISRIPLPTRLRRATFSPGEGLGRPMVVPTVWVIVHCQLIWVVVGHAAVSTAAEGRFESGTALQGCPTPSIATARKDGPYPGEWADFARIRYPVR